MIRKIIKIDEDACIGCGRCVHACHENAIGMVDGKARLLRDDYCDALGDCLPACPVDAIHFVEREAAAFDADAVGQHKETMELMGEKASWGHGHDHEHGHGDHRGGHHDHGHGERDDRGEHSRGRRHRANELDADAALVEGELLLDVAAQDAAALDDRPSGLAQWPCQIKLMPVKAPYYDGADLLVAADCTAFACPDFSDRFMRGKVTVIGCPKLDGVDYSDKLAEILCANDVNSVTVARMEVPCCGGLQAAVERAVNMSARRVPVTVVTIATDGRVLSEE